MRPHGQGLGAACSQSGLTPSMDFHPNEQQTALPRFVRAFAQRRLAAGAWQGAYRGQDPWGAAKLMPFPQRLPQDDKAVV